MKDYFDCVRTVKSEHNSKWFYAKLGVFWIYFLHMPILSDGADFCLANVYDGVAGSVSAKESENSKEYQLKTAFLFNFIKFVEWPAVQAGGNKDASPTQEPFRIGIIGKDPFKDVIEGLRDKTVRNQKLEIIRLEGLSSFITGDGDNKKAIQEYIKKYQKQIQSFQVLFICDSEKNLCREMMEVIGQASTLIVSDIENIAENGGVIGFVKEEGKIRFDIKLDFGARVS